MELDPHKPVLRPEDDTDRVVRALSLAFLARFVILPVAKAVFMAILVLVLIVLVLIYVP